MAKNKTNYSSNGPIRKKIKPFIINTMIIAFTFVIFDSFLGFAESWKSGLITVEAVITIGLGVILTFIHSMHTGVDNLTTKVGEVETQVVNGFEHLKGILRFHVQYPHLFHLIGVRLINAITSLISREVHPVSDNTTDRKYTVAQHLIANNAILSMLNGIATQVENAAECGLFIESQSPEPELKTSMQYTRFIANTVEHANYFMGVALMPPSWWREDKNSEFDLYSILEKQKIRVDQLKAENKDYLKDYLFARIFVVHENYIENWSKFDLNIKPIEDRKAKIKEYQNAGALKDYEDIIELYLNAATPEEFNNIKNRLAEKDKHLIYIKKFHDKANILFHFRVANDVEYHNSHDFVYIVSDYHDECVIKSFGFDAAINASKPITGDEQLKIRMYDHLKGFMEGRLFFIQDEIPSQDDSILKQARNWWEEEVNELYNKQSIDDGEKSKLLHYLKQIREPWDKKRLDALYRKNKL